MRGLQTRRPLLPGGAYEQRRADILVFLKEAGAAEEDSFAAFPHSAGCRHLDLGGAPATVADLLMLRINSTPHARSHQRRHSYRFTHDELHTHSWRRWRGLVLASCHAASSGGRT